MVPSCDGIAGGTSCVDLSSQKNNCKDGVLKSSEGSSSETFFGLLAFCKRHRPRVVFGENVWNLVSIGDSSGTSNWNDMKEKFMTIGYLLVYIRSDTIWIGLPHRRRRVYYFGFPLNGQWYLILEARLAQDAMHTFSKLLEEEGHELLGVDLFRVESDTQSVPDRFLAAKDWYGPEQEEAKLPVVHASFCADSNIAWPVADSVQTEKFTIKGNVVSNMMLKHIRPISYDDKYLVLVDIISYLLAYSQSRDVLEVAFPPIAVLPWRELDLSQITDHLLTTPETRGSGLSKGRKVYLDSSQAADRKPWCCGHLSCILPGSKMIDLAAPRILSSSHLLRLQGVLPSLDFKLDYDCVSERTGADMAGNAMSGHCFGNAVITLFTNSRFKPRTRISGKRARPGAAPDVVHDASSGLGVLFNL